MVTSENKFRIYSLDLLRGLVMVIMALDHTRDFFHFDAFQHDPLDVKTTSVYLYFTRWITHFCAPVFVFLAGTSIYLQQLRKSTTEMGSFLLKRGAWLIFVETVLITFAWTFEFSFPAIILQVIWAIGISMVLMAFLIRLPFKLILITGLLIVFGHNVFDYVKSTHSGFVWDLLRNGNFATHQILPGTKLVIIYPFVPWLGLMMLGYCLGKVYHPGYNAINRNKQLLWLGLSVTFFFIALRLANSYGNPNPWESQPDGVFTLLSFLDVKKYPPSLLFACMTIGPALVFLSLFENINNRVTKAISVFGSVPFFITCYISTCCTCSAWYYLYHVVIPSMKPLLIFSESRSSI